MPPSTETPQRIAELRDRRGLSQARLARRLRDHGYPLDRTAVTRIESGERGISIDDLVAIAAALNVSPGWLLLPARSDDEPVEIVGSWSAPAWQAWQWVDGLYPLPTASEDDGYNSPEEMRAFQEGRPADLRERETHPAAKAAKYLSQRVQRVLSHVDKSPRRKGDRGLETTLKAARQAVARVSDELDEIEQQAQETGGRR